MKFNKSLLTLSMAVLCFGGYADSDVTAEKSAQNTPDGWTAVELPTIATITETNTFNITSYGASTTSTDNASAINQAIAAANTAGGGMVVIPAGTWLSGPIAMKSKVVLHLSANATLKLLPFGGANQNIQPGAGSAYYPTDGQGANDAGKYSYPVFLSNTSWNGSKYTTATISDVIVEGEGSTSVIDGQGAAWWAAYKEVDKRPSLIRFGKGQRFLFRNFKLLNSPGTNLTLGQSGNASHFTVHNVTIEAPSSELKDNPSHNTDGIPVWGPYVNIYDCDISTGDDNVVFDSNSQYGHVWNCRFGEGHGASIGSYTTNVHDILWEDITFTNTGAGFRLKSNYDRSGDVYNITMQNCTMTGVHDPIYMTMWYDTHPVPNDATCQADAVTSEKISFHDITFKNITSTGTASNSSVKHYFPVFIFGRPNTKIYNVTFDNVQISAQKGMFMAYCDGVTFKNKCNITPASMAANSYDYHYVGNIDGTANATYDDASSSGGSGDSGNTSQPTESTITRKNLKGIYFSMVVNAEHQVKIGFGQDADPTEYDVTVTGGTATLHNGHASADAAMIKPEGIDVGNSGGSYLKIELNQPLRTGDILTTIGTPDGGYVTTTEKSSSENVIVNHQFTIPESMNGESTLYLWRGAKDATTNKYCLIQSLTIARPLTLSQKKEWNFSTWDAGEISGSTTKDGLTVAATSEKKVAIGSNALKLGGSGNKDYRNVSFDVTGPCLIKVYFANANSTDDGTRTMKLSFGGFGTNTIDLASVGKGESTTGTYYYSGEATTAYLYSGNSGLNIYDIQVIPTYCIVGEEVWYMTPVGENNEFIVPDAISLIDKTTFSTMLPLTAKNISYTRTMSRQWGTLCLPFAVTQSQTNNPYDFYTIQSAAADAITFSRIKDGTIPAGTPMVVRRNEAETGISIVETDAPVVCDPVTGQSANGLTLQGTFAGTTISSGSGYYIASDKFWQATKTITIPAYRAYFAGALPEGSNQLRILLSDEEFELTGIELVNPTLDLERSTFYNLQGGKQPTLRPGMNIVRMHDGSCRKIIVK